ncbi:hypothetical protein FA15DRAFT_702683 [Coprinopsis marcescibilis]|uniref:Uncharacterized protein n=1 Tax=Coprinopsis marcescibilis TaxID=230819 RepID=A0A5C3L1Z4_COPMA|nr:hypothetical protein FA15DRAFT_702683 [Coprinopsis marcescibilis]
MSRPHPSQRTRQVKKLPLIHVNDTTKARTIFARRLPFWGTTFGTAGFLLCDLIISGSAIHLTYNHWSEGVAVATPEGSQEKQPQQMEYQLRPTWQRVGLCAAHFVAGCCFAGGLLAMKAQLVRSVILASPPVRPGQKPVGEIRRLIVQTAAHRKDVGYSFSAKDTWLEKGRDDTEVLLRSSYGSGRFHLKLAGASIDEQKYPSTEESRKKIIEVWREFTPQKAG